MSKNERISAAQAKLTNAITSTLLPYSLTENSAVIWSSYRSRLVRQSTYTPEYCYGNKLPTWKNRPSGLHASVYLVWIPIVWTLEYCSICFANPTSLTDIFAHRAEQTRIFLILAQARDLNILYLAYSLTDLSPPL